MVDEIELFLVPFGLGFGVLATLVVVFCLIHRYFCRPPKKDPQCTCEDYLIHDAHLLQQQQQRGRQGDGWTGMPEMVSVHSAAQSQYTLIPVAAGAAGAMGGDRYVPGAGGVTSSANDVENGQWSVGPEMVLLIV